MGNSCKGTLATSMGNMEPVNATQAHSQNECVEDTNGRDNVSTSDKMIDHPANVITVELKSCRVKKVTLGGTKKDLDSKNEYMHSSDEHQFIMPDNNDQSLSSSHAVKERQTDEQLLFGFPHTQNDIGTVVNLTKDTPNPNEHVDFTKNDYSIYSAGDLEDVRLKTMHSDKPYESADVINEKSFFVSSRVSNAHYITPPRMVKGKENITCDYILRSNSFEGIETLTLEDITKPVPLHDDKTGNTTVEENARSPLPLLPLYAKDNLGIGNELRHETNNKNISRINPSHKVSFEDQNELTCSEEAPRAVINLLHSLYYGKQSKYRGYSSLRGKGRALSRYLRNIPNLQKELVILDTKLHAHDLSALIEHGDSSQASTIDTVCIRPESEKSEKLSLVPSNSTTNCDHRLPNSLETEFSENSPDYEGHPDKACLSHTSSSPTFRFPFNIYKERNQKDTQALFPLADYRFDDGAFTKGITTIKANFIVKSKNDYDQSTSLALNSTLSVDDQQTKTIGPSDGISSRAYPTGLGLYLPAGTSLNEVCVNVSSSSLKNDNLKAMDTGPLTMPHQKSSGRTNISHKNDKSALFPDQQNVTKSKKQSRRSETMRNFPPSPEESNRTLDNDKIFKDQPNMSANNEFPLKSKHMLSNFALNRQAVGFFAPLNIHALDFQYNPSSRLKPSSGKYSHIQNINTLKMSVYRENSKRFPFLSSCSESFWSCHNLLAEKNNKKSDSNKLIYSRHMNK